MTDRSSVLVVPILYIVRYCEYVKILRFHFQMMYRRAQIKAAEQDTSVSAPVREFLMSLGEEESDFGHRKRLQSEVIASIESFRAGDRLDREKALPDFV